MTKDPNSETPASQPAKTPASENLGSKAFLFLCVLALLSSVVYLVRPVGNRPYHLILTGISKGNFDSFLAKFPPYEGKEMGGAAHAATLLDRMIASFSGEPYNFLSIGSEISGTANSYFSRGEAPIKVLGSLGLQGMLVGNIEFSFGRNRLQELSQAAKFPFISSNVIDEGTGAPPKFLSPDLLLNPGNGLGIGIIGITPPNTPNLTAQGNVSGLKFLSLDQGLLDRVNQLRKRGAQLVVMLSLLEKDKLPPEDWAMIAGAHPDVVVMMDFEVEEVPWELRDGIYIKTVNGYNRGKELELLDLEISRFPEKIVSFKARRLPICSEDFPPKESVEELIDQTTGGIKALKAEPIATFSGNATRQFEQECPIGNMVAEAVRDLYQADIGIQNSGGIQADISSGVFTLGDLFDVLPFDNQVVCMDLSGMDLQELLSTSASLKRGLLQISGGSYSFSNRGGDDYELKEVSVGSAPIDPQKTYKVSTNSFLAGGGDEFRSFKRGRNVQFGLIQRDAVRKFLEKLSASGCITLSTDGRIKRE